MQKPRQYKALIVDLDGTCLRAGFENMPSDGVVDAISALVKRGIPVSVATGRNISQATSVIKALGVVEPCMMANGAIIYDPVVEKVLECVAIDRETLTTIINIVSAHKKDVLVDTMYEQYIYAPQGFKDGDVVAMHIIRLTKKRAEALVHELKALPNIAAYCGPDSFTGKFYYIGINEVRATKQRALQHVLKRLQIQAEDIIAVGDGNNDLPMVLAAGMGVAMGNASDDLKAVADYIAPSVDEDGVVHVIDKFFPSS